MPGSRGIRKYLGYLGYIGAHNVRVEVAWKRVSPTGFEVAVVAEVAGTAQTAAKLRGEVAGPVREVAGHYVHSSPLAPVGVTKAAIKFHRHNLQIVTRLRRCMAMITPQRAQNCDVGHGQVRSAPRQMGNLKCITSQCTCYARPWFSLCWPLVRAQAARHSARKSQASSRRLPAGARCWWA